MSTIISLEEAAAILSAPVAKTRRLLKNLPCIDYGKGRGGGKRWRRADVEKLLDNLFKEETKPCRPGKVADMKAADIFALTTTRVLQ